MEAMVDVLWDSLSSDDINSVPLDVRQKVEDNFRNELEGYNSLKEEFEKLKANSDHQIFLFEKQLTDAQKQLSEFKKEVDAQKEENLELLKDYEPIKNELHNTQALLEKLQNDHNKLESDKQFLDKEKQDLFDLLERRNTEIQRLNMQVESLTNQYNESNNAKCETLSKYHDLMSKEASLEQKEKFFQQERDGLYRQIDLLNDQLEESNKQITYNNSQNAKVLMESQLRLTELSEENDKLKDDFSFLKEEKEKLKEVHAELVEKLKEAREYTLKMDENYSNELRTQRQLAQLHEESLKDEKAKFNEIARGAEELRKLLKESSTMYGELEEKLKRVSETYVATLNEKEEEIEDLKKELSNANALLDFAKQKGFTDEGIESLSPAAASACKILKSGMSLTQIYSEYIRLSAELHKEKQINKDLHSYLNEILEEFQERAPCMKKQRVDYNDAMESISTLTSQLDAAVKECDQLKFEVSDNKRKMNQITRERHRQQALIKDLRAQVCVLLKQVEECRGRPITDMSISSDRESDRDTSYASNEFINCEKLISSELVTFKDIEELQVQNERLLSLLREETERRESQEQQKRDYFIEKLQTEIDSGLNEVEQLKAERDQHKLLIDNLANQRDTYKAIVQGTAKMEDKLVTSTPIVGLPSGQAASGNNSFLEMSGAAESLKHLQNEFDSYKTEKCEQEVRFKDELQNLRNDVEKERMLRSKLETDLEYAQEKSKVSVKNLEIYKKQISALEEKCQNFNKMIGGQERSIATMKEDMLTLQQNYARAQARCESLQEEKLLLKQSEARYLQEKEFRAKEQSLQGSLLSTFEHIKLNLEKREFETQMKLENQVDHLQKELVALRRKADHDFEQYKESVRVWEKDSRELRNQLEQMKGKETKTQEELMNSYAMVHKLESEVQELKQKLINRSHSVDDTLHSPSLHQSNYKDLLLSSPNDKRCDELELKLKEADNVIESLKSEIESCKNHTEIFKNMSENLEKELRQSNANIESIRSDCEKKCQECVNHQIKLQDKIDVLEGERQNLMIENSRLNREVMATTGDLRVELNAALAQLESAKTVLADNEVKLQSLTAELSEQTKLAVEASHKYERELVAHAESVQNFAEAKKQLVDISDKFEALEQEKKDAFDTLKSKEESWLMAQNMHKEESKSLQDRIQEFENINNCLHHQVEMLSIKLNSVTAIEDKKFEEMPGSCSSDQLMQLYQFARKEKDLLQAKFNIVDSEKLRYECKIENLQKRLEEANTALIKMNEESKVSALSTGQHAELLRKVELLQTLTDSNRVLREERGSLACKYEQALERLESMEKTYPNLEVSNKELNNKVSTLEVENDVLKNELKRWQQRTNQLAEKASKTSAEDLKKLAAEKEQLNKQVAQVTEDIKKLQAEKTKVDNSLKTSQNETVRLRNLNLQYHEENKKKVGELEAHIKQLEEASTKSANELKSLRAEVSKKEAEMNKLAQETNAANKNKDEAIQQKVKQLAELQKSIIQVRKIGRKYKSQYETLIVKYRTLETKVKGGEGADKEVNDVVNTDGDDQMGMGDDISEDNQDGRLQECMDKLKETQETLAVKETEMGRLAAEIDELKSELQNTSAGGDKEERSRKVLQTARQKIQELSHKNAGLLQEKNKLQKELQDVLSKQESNAFLDSEEQLRMLTLKSQFEGKINKLEKEAQEFQRDKIQLTEQIAALTEEKDQLVRATETLQHKLNLQQKQLENYQKQLCAQGSKSCQSVSSSEPPTANIKPLAAPTPPATRPQTSQVSHSIAPSKMTPTASIRPIAMTTPQHSRMATVMPNTQHQTPLGVSMAPEVSMATVSVQSTETYSAGLPQAAVQPTPASRRREDGMEDSAMTVCVTPQVQVQQLTSSQSTSTETSEIVEESIQQPHAIAMVTPQQQHSQVVVTSESSSDVVAASSSSTCVLIAPSVKRGRDSDLEGSSVGANKRARTSSETREAGTSEQQVLDDRSQSPMSSHLEDPPQSLHIRSSSVDRSDNEEDDDDDVIVIGSDEETMEDEAKTDDQEDNDDWEEEEEDNEEGQESESNDIIEEGDEDSVDNDDNLEIDEESNAEAQDEEAVDRDVEILTDNDSSLDIHVSSASENVGQEAEVVTSSTSVSRAAPPASLSRTPGRQERIVSSGRHQTLASYMTLGQFEEGDDRAVPSTPTLFLQNRRDDGFAEAVSSPQVTAQRFIFGSSSDIGSGSNQAASLSSQVTHMIDDTRMDLSQLEDSGTGRSVPSTPLQVSPPVDDFQCEKPSSSNSLVVPNSTVDSSVSSDQLNLLPIINVRTIHDEELSQGVEESQETGQSNDEGSSEVVQSENSQDASESQEQEMQETSSHDSGEFSGRDRQRMGRSHSSNKPMLRRPITWHSSPQYGMMRGLPFGGRPQRSRRSRGNFKP